MVEEILLVRIVVVRPDDVVQIYLSLFRFLTKVETIAQHPILFGVLVPEGRSRRKGKVRRIGIDQRRAQHLERPGSTAPFGHRRTLHKASAGVQVDRTVGRQVRRRRYRQAVTHRMVVVQAGDHRQVARYAVAQPTFSVV